MPALLRRLQSLSTRLWETTQVELHGHYSLEQLQRLEHYCAHTSWLRAITVCVLTPVPCIAIVVLLDALPLEPPANGTLGSPNVWTRQWFTVFLISFCTMQQVRQHLPQLALTHWEFAILTVLSTATAVGTSFSLSNVVGYPLPFTVVVGTPPWFVVISLLIFAFKRHLLRSEPGLARNVRRYLLVLLCQVALTMIYPSYNFVYSRLSSLQQTAFIMLLPVIKIATKNWISRALPDTDDAKPEAVVFNVEIFHALFVALCMGSTTSGRTIVALMLVDLVQAWLSFQDVLAVIRSLRPLAAKLDTQSLLHLVPLVRRVIAMDALAEPSTMTKRQTWFTPTTVAPAPLRGTIHKSVAPAPTPLHANTNADSSSKAMAVVRVASSPSRPSLQPGPTESAAGKTLQISNLATLSAAERALLVLQTQKLLYVTEFIVLVEYTEVIMPIIYDTLVFAMYYRPNRVYYTFLFGVCTTAQLHTTTANVLLYAALEFASLVAMAVIVWWQTRFSLIHQLAFVLEHRATNIHAKLLLWVLDTMQTSIVQLGPDYSFQFAWLHRGDGDATHDLGGQSCPSPST